MDKALSVSLAQRLRHSAKTFVAQNSSYDWKLPDDSTIVWEGIHPNAQNLTELVTASESTGTLTIEPAQASAQFKILTDFEVRHGANALSNLQSLNKYIQKSIIYQKQLIHKVQQNFLAYCLNKM